MNKVAVIQGLQAEVSELQIAFRFQRVAEHIEVKISQIRRQ